MIPKHDQFLTALAEHKKVSLKFFSQPDAGVVERICAPLAYGPGLASKDNLNRYWVWDYAGTAHPHTLGLVPPQIVELQVLGEVFDPAQLTGEPSPVTTIL